MTTPFVSISDIVYVDFRKKRVIYEQVLSFDKMVLLREGLSINYDRLIRRGKVSLAIDNERTKCSERSEGKQLDWVWTLP
jgi:hypothetical protein